MKEKSLFYTDNDLDGAVSAFILNNNIHNGEIIFTQNKGNVDSEINKILDKEIYKNIYITDLYPKNKKVIKKINDLYINGDKNIILLDHHLSAIYLNKYKWANVIYSNNNVQECGASLVTKYLMNKGYDMGRYQKLVEIVRQYDTWQHSLEWELGAQLNNIYNYYDLNKFYKKLQSIINKDIIFTEEEKLISNIIDKLNISYMEKINKNYKFIRRNGYNVGVIFADKFPYKCLDYLLTKNNHLDFAININLATKTINLKSNKEKINVGKIALKNKGGGQVKTGGIAIPENIILELIDKIKL